ncbi:hypothetical protein FNU79_06110 [Deinococcus detaillensis]|uniref:YCII-related domain-containing protein n=1 Tax=Deinococcus detaillensis TaxID=2592048 RepID=A0A553V3E7_9DEIO|nr:YciI family protein [Deinococcus detaillensis]TSA86761.1 hypothetical protein FNU79_06110 [Deinococcus detaillensis]
MKPYFVLIYRPGPNWVQGKPVFGQALGPHLAYMKGLNEGGLLKMAGPYPDDASGLIVLNVTSADQAHQIMQGDPAIATQMMCGTVHPWLNVLED